MLERMLLFGPFVGRTMMALAPGTVLKDASHSASQSLKLMATLPTPPVCARRRVLGRDEAAAAG